MCAGPNFRRVFPCYSTAYTLIRGHDFFEKLLDELETAGVSCTWGCSSVEVTSSTITVDAHSRHFDLVVDAAFNPAQSTAKLWQSFGGIWVRSERPLFEPDVATLMDLDVPSSSAAVRFMYLLPTSPTTALVEHTVFARTPFSQEQHLTECSSWAERQGYTDLQICEREYGRIPMGLERTYSPGQPMRIGTAAGAVRISTGYGFQAILREASLVARLIASNIANKRPPPRSHTNPWPRWIRLCDTLFVTALARHPSNGQSIMAELLRRAPEAALIPFLAGTASLSQALKVMSGVPKLRMLQALAKREEFLHETT